MRPALKRLFLLAASTDTKAVRTEEGFTAPCLHCRSTLAVRADGEALGNATLEHVVPVSWFGKRSADRLVAGLDGPDDARNLALACRRCNHDKGTGPDARGPADARAFEIVAKLVATRLARFPGEGATPGDRAAYEEGTMTKPAPPSRTAGYSGTPLPRKLGIKPGSVVALFGAPDDFEKTLGALPEGVSLRRVKSPATPCDVGVWFVRSAAELAKEIGKRSSEGGFRHLWIANPKLASGVRTDVTQNLVRDAGLAHGLVDFKVCAIDATWTGLCFTRRKA